tara:strand:+ start:707 stop:2551 length:1845 start_codon:yes stop_codon:yes gene_type:complete
MSNIYRLYKKLAQEGGLTLAIAGTVLLLKALATVFEGVGVAMLVPVFEVAGTGGERADLAERPEIVGYIDRLFEAVGVEMTFESLLLATAVLVILRQITTYVHRVYFVAAQQRMTAILRERGVAASFAAHISYHDETPTGHIVNDLVTESQRAVGVVFAVFGILGNLIVTLIYIAGIAIASGWLMVGALAATGALSLGLRRLMRRSRDNSEVLATANRNLSKLVFDRLKAVRLLKLAGSEAKEAVTVGGAIEEARASALYLAKLQARIPLFIEPAGAVILIGLFYVGIRAFDMPFEIMVVIVLVLARLIPVIQEMAKGVQVFLSGYGSLRFIVERIESAVAACEIGTDRSRGFPKRLVDGVTFENLHFAYPSANGRAALDGVTFQLPASQLTAIVGPSGAGKSTLIDLLPSLRLPSEGNIRFDGLSANEISPDELRRNIAFVPQFPLLLSGTIGEHIRYGRPEATEAAVAEAARLAGAQDFIAALPAGFDSNVGEDGVGLSGGQRQRVDLARALLENKPLLVLDEPSSNLDAESEEAFRNALERIRHASDTTIVLIAHRLASVSTADRIVVLKQGRVDGIGTHAELMAAGGWYSHAYRTSLSDTPDVVAVVGNG